MLFTVKGNTTRAVLGGEVLHSKGSRFDFKTTFIRKEYFHEGITALRDQKQK